MILLGEYVFAFLNFPEEFMYCDAHPEAAVNESIPPGGPQFFSRRLGSVVPVHRRRVHMAHLGTCPGEIFISC